jgi:hypothetical protein
VNGGASITAVQSILLSHTDPLVAIMKAREAFVGAMGPMYYEAKQVCFYPLIVGLTGTGVCTDTYGAPQGSSKSSAGCT